MLHALWFAFGKNRAKNKPKSGLMQKKRPITFLCEKLGRTITFWGAKIDRNFFYKKWAILVAA